MIQGSINQLLNQVAIFGRLAPGYESRQEVHRLKKEQSVLAKQGKAMEESYKSTSVEDVKALSDLMGREASVAEKMFQVDPTTKNYEDMISKQKESRVTGTALHNLAFAMNESQESLGKRQMEISQSKPKRNFMDYLGKQETSLGGTVSQLPPNMQKQIAAQYSKGDRQRMMNQMDKEVTK